MGAPDEPTPTHPRMSDHFFYFSQEKTGGWRSAPSSQRQHVVDAKAPRYVTVLDLDALIEDDSSLEDQLKVKYAGPMYFDWDCDSIEDGAASVNRFLDLLESEYGVDLNSITLYATGGRGYHAEIPFAVFSSSKTALQYLPAVYKEMANSLFTEDMDLAIYSAKRGRMWRTPNVEREKAGRFKVPISVEQMRGMTPEIYDELCSAPRVFPLRTDAVLSPQLAALFADHKKKVDQRYRERKTKKSDDGAIKRFNGEWPESVKTLMNGENLSPDVGLNKIAMQLGILSSALGKTLDQHIEACEGLIKTYKGDHNTRRAVRDELKRMFNYVNGNVAYTYSPAAMAAIMATPQTAKDLRGAAAPTGGDKPEDMGDLACGMVSGSNGLYSVKEDLLKRETNWHYDPETATEIVDATTMEPKGFILMGKDSGNVTKEVNVDHGVFVSGDKFKGFLAARGATAPRMDSMKAGGVLALIMQHARQNGRVLALDKEGFNLVTRPGVEELVWSSPSGCWANDSQETYRYRSTSGSEAGNFQSDIMTAPEIRDHGKAGEVIDALLGFNLNPFTVASMVGWFVSCWHKPLHIASGQSFPILQAHGESGSGKTMACMTFLHMFYNHVKPKAMNASQGTAYGRRVMFCGSSTIPILVDEFKPREMSQDQARDFRMTIHEMYTPAFQSPRGGGDARSTASGNWAELSFETKTTPMCFTTETEESQTAIQERCLSVPFSKATRTGAADEAFQTLTRNHDVIAALGKLLLMGTAASKRDSLKGLIARSHDIARERLMRSGNSRIVYNAGVALAGLGFLGMVLRHHMPQEYAERFEARLEVLRMALLDESNYTTLQAAPEIVKLLRFMVTVSHQDDKEADHNVRHGTEYAYHRPGMHLDISVDAFYLRYRTACQRRSQVPAFTDPDSFLSALRSSSLFKEHQPADSELAQSTNAARIVRLNADALDEYGLGAFLA